MTGLGVDELGELVENVGHLVSAFAAADIYDYISLGPLGELMLNDRLARAERAGNGRDAALGYRKERVDNSLTGDEGHIRRQLFLIRSADTDRPLLHKGDLAGISVVVDYNSHGIGDGVLAA